MTISIWRVAIVAILSLVLINIADTQSGMAAGWWFLGGVWFAAIVIPLIATERK